MLDCLDIDYIVESYVKLYPEAEAGAEEDISATSDTTSDMEQERTDKAESKRPTPFKSPDSAFFLDGFGSPPFIVEIAFSQKAEELPQLVAKYYEQSKHQIHTALTVDIGYLTPSQRTVLRRETRERKSRTTKVTQAPRLPPSSHGLDVAETHPAENSTTPLPTCHISLWRDNKPVLDNHVFRDNRGQAVEGGLELSIADFVPWEGVVKGGHSEESDSDQSDLEADFKVDKHREWTYWRSQLQQFTFTVPFTELCKVLAKGEKQQELDERTPPRLYKTQSAGGKRRRDVDTEWESKNGQERQDKQHQDIGGSQ